MNEERQVVKKARAIYFDVGCWQTKKEREEPIMTFGLLEHNGIALCSFYSNGRKRCRIPKKIGNRFYDFEGSLINDFLTIMMANKYGRAFLPFRRDVSAKEYHVLKIIPFPPKSLLDDENQLIILIPDLHLHYFKGTYLDNFVSYYENRWNGNKPESSGPGSRRSMENDFGVFLQSIIKFREKSDVNSKVVFLGDTYEMWETHVLFYLYGIHNADRNALYKALQEVIVWMEEQFEGGIKEMLTKIRQLKISEVPIDEEFKKQILELQKDEELVKKLYISRDDSGEEINEKAKNLATAILSRYHDQNGERFEELIPKIGYKWWFPGNHDNFLAISSMEPLDLVKIGQNKIDPSRVGTIRDGAKRADIFYEHGHTFDPANSDLECGLGYWVTGISTFFEAKKRGDFFKKYEKEFRNSEEIRLIHKKNACKVFKYWEGRSFEAWKEKAESEQERWLPAVRNNVMIHAHTHDPLLQDITNGYRIWKGASGIFEEEEGSIIILNAFGIIEMALLFWVLKKRQKSQKK